MMKISILTIIVMLAAFIGSWLALQTDRTYAQFALQQKQLTALDSHYPSYNNENMSIASNTYDTNMN